jgi:hypothetical protein
MPESIADALELSELVVERFDASLLAGTKSCAE